MRHPLQLLDSIYLIGLDDNEPRIHRYRRRRLGRQSR